VVDISDAAVEKAKEVLKTEGKADWGLKLFCQGSSCCGPSFGMDIQESPANGEQTTEKNGLKIFADDFTVKSMQGLIVDFVDDGQHQGFVVKNTGQGGPCSCASGTCE
jgi:iron-sulfur cluster assembly accessory protein